MEGSAGQIVFGLSAVINQPQVDSMGVLFIDNAAFPTLKVKQSDGVVLTARAGADDVRFAL